MYDVCLSSLQSAAVYTWLNMSLFFITLQRQEKLQMMIVVLVCVCVCGKERVCVLEGLLVTGTRVSGADANEQSAAV